MYKELKEEKVKTRNQMAAEHRGLAFLIAEREQPYEDGILLESRGKLYAIADKEGLDQLYKTSHELNRQGIETVVNTMSLLESSDVLVDL